MFYNFIKYFLIVTSTFLYTLSKAQINIFQGNILDGKGNKIEGASIIISPSFPYEQTFSTYSNSNGFFSLNIVKNNWDTIYVMIRSIGYKNIDTALPKISYLKNLTFFLTEAPFILPSVKVKSKSMNQRKDTINFDAQSLRKPSDRFLGDILKDLPGIEVADDGTIKYQGKSINKFYIEGLDLLGDKYNLASKNISANHISQIQILENHQPIKILDSILQSTRAALNIKLISTAKNRLIGNMIVGMGLSPIAADIVITNMYFNKNQFLNIYKYNNIGKNYASEINRLNYKEMTDNLNGHLVNSPLLSIPLADLPPVKLERIIFNNLHIISLNNIRKLKKESTLQTQLDATIDRQKQSADINVIQYFTNDTIRLLENQNLVLNPWSIRGSMEYMKNNSSYYLSNNTKLLSTGSINRGIIYNDKINNQKYQDFQFGISNSTQKIIRRGKWIIDMYHYANYSYTKQRLSLSPDININKWLKLTSPTSLQQNLNLETFYNKFSFSGSKKIGLITFNNKIFLSSTYQNFGTYLNNSDTKTTFSSDTLQNNLKISQHTLNVSSGLQYNFHSFLLSSGVNFQVVTQNKRITRFNEKYIYQPAYNFSILYKANNKLGVSMSLSSSQINESPYYNSTGYAINTFRNIINNNNNFRFIQMNNLNFQIDYKNIIKAIFGSLGVQVQNSTSNTISSQTFINTLSISNYILTDNSNSQSYWYISTNKYWYKLRTSFSTTFYYQKNNSVQILEQIPTSSYVNTVGLNTRFSTTVAFISISYIGRWQFVNLSQGNSMNANNTNFIHNIELSRSLLKKFIFNLNAEQYFVKKGSEKKINFLFLDINIEKKEAIKNWSFSLSWQNITNTKSYFSNVISANMFSQYDFNLRPSQLIIRLSHPF